MKIAVVTGSAVTRHHGSGVQILRIFDGTDAVLGHLFWSTACGLQSELPGGLLLKGLPRLKRLRGVRLIEAVERAAGVAWWNGDDVNARKLRRVLSGMKWECDTVYVSISNEREARRARSILDVLGRPYVLHMMDLCHDEGINPGTMPGYAGLIGGAHSVLVVSEPMRREALKVRSDNVELVALGKSLTPAATAPPDASGKVRMVMLGSLGAAGNPALELLADAMPMLRKRYPGFELLYMGQHRRLLPERLRLYVTSPGDIDMATFERLLPTAHLAFLPSPSRLDCYARFAPLGRLVDYFMAGLPILYHVVKGSLAEQSLSGFSSDATQSVATPEDMTSAVLRFLDPVRWHAANRRLRGYAVEHFNIDGLRARVMKKLATASGLPNGGCA